MHFPFWTSFNKQMKQIKQIKTTERREALPTQGAHKIQQKRGIKRQTAFASVICAMGVLAGCGVSLSRYQNQFLDVFDTVSTIIGYSKNEDSFQKTYSDAHDLLLDCHRLYDIYNDYDGINNLKTVNDNAGIAPVKVDQKIIDLVKFGKEVYEITDGKVNIAGGSVLSVWHDKREAGISDPEHAELPKDEDLKQAAEHTDINNIIIDEANSTIYLSDPDMSLDVGGIAKGYSAELAAKQIISEGNKSFCVNLGGNVRTIGTRADGKKWVIPIENPDYRDGDTNAEQYAVVTNLDGKSLVTSGDYERYYTVNGVRYSHLIDPDTLYPGTYHRSVSILTSDSGLADALSTGLFLMSVEDGKACLSNLNADRPQDDQIEACWIDADGTMTYTDGFKDYIEK
jgi:thiamine biosynthesis lipoprotein